jgi:hypothetical protein
MLREYGVLLEQQLYYNIKPERGRRERDVREKAYIIEKVN